MCGIGTQDRDIWCWEADHDAVHGQVALRAQPGPFVALAGGWDAACGLAPDGAAQCWGKNDRGQLGDAANGDRNIAAPVAGAHRFVSIAAGEYKFCGSEDNGALWCWGQLGQGVRSNVPVRSDVPGVRGPDFRVGLIGELYAFPQRQVRVHGEFGDGITRWFSGHTIRQFSLDHSACLRNMQEEVFCSWDVFRGVITHAWVPLEPIPVPPPRNGW
jgi:hypothetical protein